MKLGIGWAFFFSLVCLDVSAQEAPRPFAKIEIEPKSVIVGQPARLRVTVLVPTWFSKPAVYPSFELPNLVTRLPPNSSFPTTERINGQNWSGIVRDYVLYPQSRARYVISDQQVRVAFADPQTRKPVAVTVDVPQVSLLATVPPGAERLDPFIAGSALTIEQNIEGKIEDLAPGDAIVRIVTVTVQGAPVMFIPALLAMRHDQGYTAYAGEPELQEVLDARTGQLTSKRTESVTYVFKGSGEFELPGLTLRWWNTNSKNVEIASVSAIRATVLGGPVNTPAGADDVQDLDRAALLWGVVLVVGVFSIVALIASFRSRVNAWWQKHIAAWQASESFAFRQLSRAVARRDAHQIYEALAIWLDRLQQGLTWDQVVHQADDPVVTPLRRLSAGLFNAGHSSAPPLDRQARGELKRTLNQVRITYRRMPRERHQATGLASLNPQFGQT